MGDGITYKQCGCHGADGKRLGRTCPRLRRRNGTWNPAHGRWHYQLELPTHADGSRRNPLRRGGFATQAEAEQEMDQARELLAIADPGDTETAIRIADAIAKSVQETRTLPDPARVRKAVGGGHDPGARPPTVGEWLQEWLTAKKKLRPGTARGYASHIRLYYQPHIGHISIDRLRVTDVASVFEAIDDLNEAIIAARASEDPTRREKVKGRRTVGPATRQRIRATLRSAIASYIRQHPGMLMVNVAALIELPAGDRPKPLVWTDGRVRAWHKAFEARLAAARARANGGRVSPLDIWIATPRPSPVMVWTPAQTQVFLAAAARHRLPAMWRLIATRGLRRGEACGLRRPDTDLRNAVTTIRWQIIQLGWETAQGPPKSDAGERQVVLDTGTVAEIRAHRHRQDKEKEAAADAWMETGFEFTSPHGTPLHPAAVTDMFEQTAYLAGLPPIRLHDLRHGAATLLQMSRIASGASFGGSRERALPAVQRAALRCRRPAGPPHGCGDLRLHGPPVSDATMMRLMPLRGVHHRCVCCHRDTSGSTRLHRVHHPAVPVSGAAAARGAPDLRFIDLVTRLTW